MKKTAILSALLFCSLVAVPIQRKAEADSGEENAKKAVAPTITITNLDVTDKTLKLRYEIKNDSERDAWILVGADKYDVSAEVFMDEDDQTLLVRRRRDVPAYVYANFADCRYVRLRAGDTQTQSVSLTLPVCPHPAHARGRRARGLEYATRLALEIGYYPGDLPAMIRGLLAKAEKMSAPSADDYLATIKKYFLGSLTFNESNEGLRARDEEVLVRYTGQKFKGEHVLRTAADGLRIPYEEEEPPERYHPNVPHCTRIEIQYEPSILEYFFPYASEQSLLSSVEKQSLRSQRTIVVEGQQDVDAFVNDVNSKVPAAGIICERSTANVTCYRDDKCVMTFFIYNDDAIVIEDEHRFVFIGNEPPQSLRMLTPQIQQLELRTKCAANMKDLWHRLRLYYKAEKNRLKDSSSEAEMAYPAPARWCDSMVLAYRSIGMVDFWLMKPYICPSAAEGKCHYAMNPHCKYDSPPDTVLLFETKGGWNQYGGPELFTFDNHDPKGGCILLNDGDVKFIRTKEEPRQLRWK